MSYTTLQLATACEILLLEKNPETANSDPKSTLRTQNVQEFTLTGPNFRLLRVELSRVLRLVEVENPPLLLPLPRIQQLLLCTLVRAGHLLRPRPCFKYWCVFNVFLLFLFYHFYLMFFSAAPAKWLFGTRSRPYDLSRIPGPIKGPFFKGVSSNIKMLLKGLSYFKTLDSYRFEVRKAF